MPRQPKSSEPHHGATWHTVGDEDGLSIEQHRAISALLTETTQQAAADQAGVNRTTLYRWLQTEPFRDAYREARKEVVGHARARLQLLTEEAAEALREVMNNSNAPAPARVSAARTVLEMADRATESEEIERRLEALENGRAPEPEQAPARLAS